MKIPWYIVVIWIIVGVLFFPWYVDLDVIFFPENSKDHFLDFVHLGLFFCYAVCAASLAFFKVNQRKEMYRNYRYMNILAIAAVFMLLYRFNHTF